MISKSWKLATVLGVVGAIALTVSSAEARTKRAPAKKQSTINSGPFAYQPPPPPRAYNYQPSGAQFRGSGILGGGPAAGWSGPP
jgi:hypothetical protein